MNRTSLAGIAGMLALVPLLLTTSATGAPGGAGDVHQLLAEHSAHVLATPSLSLDGAQTVLGASLAKAHELSTTGAIAVVDRGGHLLAFARIDGTFQGSPDISVGKARTATLFNKATAAFEQIIKDGRTPMLAIDGFTPLQGGVPVTIDGVIVGAVGVSGAASAAQDEELAMAGANVFTTEPKSKD